MERRLEKNRGHTLYQSRALFITVRMRTIMSAAHVPGNHGQLFRPCWASSVWHSRYLPRLVASNTSKRQLRVLDFVLSLKILSIFFQNLVQFIPFFDHFSLPICPPSVPQAFVPSYFQSPVRRNDAMVRGQV